MYTKGEWTKDIGMVFCGKRSIASCHGYTDSSKMHETRLENEANAQRIVTCVNNFDKVVAALQDLQLYCSCNKTSQLEPLVNNAQQALKQAEGR